MTLPSGTIEHCDSGLNDIFVIERDGCRYLAFLSGGKLHVQSAMDLQRPRRLMPAYTEVLSLALAYPARVGRVMVLGLGGATVQRGFQVFLAPETHFEFVERDPQVVRIAQAHFGFDPSACEVVVADALAHLRARTGRPCDVMVIDLYGGSTAPPFLAEREFVHHVKSVLSEGGVVAINLSPVALDAEAARSAYASSFAFADAYDAGGNLVLVCGDGGRPSPDALEAACLRLEHRGAAPAALVPLLKRRVGAQPPCGESR